MPFKVNVSGKDELLATTARLKTFKAMRSSAIRAELLPPVRTARKEIRKAYKRTTLGRKFWGRRKRRGRVPRLMLKNRPISVRQETIETGVDVKGMAALIEEGGRIKQHRITGRPFLVWPGGRARVVVHPGMRVPKEPVGEGVLRRSEPNFRTGIESGLVKLARDLKLRK